MACKVPCGWSPMYCQMPIHALTLWCFLYAIVSCTQWISSYDLFDCPIFREKRRNAICSTRRINCGAATGPGLIQYKSSSLAVLTSTHVHHDAEALSDSSSVTVALTQPITPVFQNELCYNQFCKHVGYIHIIPNSKASMWMP
ncbi:hypothetical protein EV401DRAFT_790194 [Pisolithus croceorrhizus]|nr:hypothetical protein EV401DRAFT_790194 [Pisolithus croceorrhizus]